MKKNAFELSFLNLYHVYAVLHFVNVRGKRLCSVAYLEYYISLIMTE